MFVDLQEALRSNFKIPTVAIASVGGRPVGEGWTPDRLEVRNIIMGAIGQGSLLTFNNPKGRSRLSYAEMALANGHLWALHSFHLGLLLSNIPRSFREALAFSGKFHCSWQEAETDVIAVLAHGSLRDWRKYVAHCDDDAFKPTHREILRETFNLLHELAPLVFPDSTTELRR